MGYTTEFTGQFDFDKRLDSKTHEFLIKFSDTRRMKRDVGPEYGVDGEFYVDGTGWKGQDKDSTIIGYNTPPSTQPSLWCDWAPTKDGLHIEWNGMEKFYDYVAWLEYIIKNFFQPKGYVLNGDVRWQGEEPGDQGHIVVVDNCVMPLEQPVYDKVTGIVGEPENLRDSQFSPLLVGISPEVSKFIEGCLKMSTNDQVSKQRIQWK